MTTTIIILKWRGSSGASGRADEQMSRLQNFVMIAIRGQAVPYETDAAAAELMLE